MTTMPYVLPGKQEESPNFTKGTTIKESELSWTSAWPNTAEVLKSQEHLYQDGP